MRSTTAVKVSGDTAAFRRSLSDSATEFEGIRAAATQVGAIHHRFAVADGFVLAVDEWETAEQFEKFFGDPKMLEFIGSIGGDTSTPPEITVAEAVASPDEF